MTTLTLTLAAATLVAATLSFGGPKAPHKAKTPAPVKTMRGLEIREDSPKRPDKVVHTEEEWKKLLTKEQYDILRGHGTERAFCGRFHDNHLVGTYSCVGCGLPLFKSDAKFDSGTGWPSFFQPVDPHNVWLKEDRSYGMVRLEVLCARCDGHLGHVFEDGPAPTGLRFCMNSEVMTFAEEKK